MKYPVVALLACWLLAASVQAQAPEAAAPAAETGTVLITGANRGIGLELARQYAAAGWRVIATARSPREADALRDLARANDRVTVERLDVTSDRSVKALAGKYRGVPIDVLLNNAGILGDVPAQKLGSYDFQVFDEIFDVNVEGPVRMVNYFIDNVAASRQKKIMTMSSAVGSIELTFAGQMFYRSSKAALNMAMRTLSKEVKRDPDPARHGVIFGLINPGVVDTGFAKNVPIPMITAEESARACIALIGRFSPDMSGGFYDYKKGNKLPW